MTKDDSAKSVYLLTGDIGGTNSRMSLYEVGNPQEPKLVIHYRNYENLPDHVLSDPDAFPMRIIVPFLETCWSNTTENELAPLEESEIVACIGNCLMHCISRSPCSATRMDGSTKAVPSCLEQPLLERLARSMT